MPEGVNLGPLYIVVIHTIVCIIYYIHLKKHSRNKAFIVNDNPNVNRTAPIYLADNTLVAIYAAYSLEKWNSRIIAYYS